MGNVCARDDTEQAYQDNQPVNNGDLRPTNVQQGQPSVVEPQLKEDVENDKIFEQEQEIMKQSSAASDWTAGSVMNPPAPAAKQAMEKRPKRMAVDYAELRPFHAAQVKILKNVKNGGTYQGNVVSGLPEGWGIVISKNGEILEGIFEKGQAVRRIRFVYNNGNVYEGTFNNGKISGRGTIIRPNGTSTTCQSWTAGKLLGPIENRDASGKLVFSGIKNANGQPNGAKIMIVDKEARIEGKYTNGVPVDKMIKKYHNGKVYEGPLNKQNMEEGVGVITFVDSRKYKGLFLNGQPNGQGTLITDYGKEVQTTWKNGRRV